MNATSHRPFLRWALLIAAVASAGAVAAAPAGVAAASAPQPVTVGNAIIISDPGGDGPGPKIVAIG
jgi:hypothetical protein